MLEKVSFLDIIRIITNPKTASSTYLAHCVFHHTAHIPYGNECACSIEKAYHLLPGDVGRCSGRLRLQSAVPCSSDDNEEQEDQYLQDQTTENDVFASLNTVLIFGLYKHASTTALYEETQDISGDKHLCYPFGTDNRKGCRVGAHDQTSKNHIDGGREEDGRDQNQNRLYDIRNLRDSVVMRCCACSISDGLELGRESVCCISITG